MDFYIISLAGEIFLNAFEQACMTLTPLFILIELVTIKLFNLELQVTNFFFRLLNLAMYYSTHPHSAQFAMERPTNLSTARSGSTRVSNLQAK